MAGSPASGLELALSIFSLMVFENSLHESYLSDHTKVYEVETSNSNMMDEFKSPRQAKKHPA